MTMTVTLTMTRSSGRLVSRSQKIPTKNLHNSKTSGNFALENDNKKHHHDY